MLKHAIKINKVYKAIDTGTNFVQKTNTETSISSLRFHILALLIIGAGSYKCQFCKYRRSKMQT